MTVYNSPWGSVPTVEQSCFDFLWSNPNRVSDDEPAFIHGGTGQILTRKQLKADTQRLAHFLSVDLGLTIGDVVAVFSPNTMHYPTMVHACQCAGLVFSGANAAYTRSELLHQLHEASAKVLFCHPDLLSIAQTATQQLGWSQSEQRKRIVLAVDRSECPDRTYRTLDEAMGPAKLEPVRIAKPKEQVAFLCFSSGTTSAAKGVETTHYNMTSVCLGLKPLDYGSSDLFLWCLPMNHIFGVLLPKFEPKAFCEVVQRFKITQSLVVPPMILSLARYPDVTKYDWSSMRSMLSGGAPLSATLQKELMDKIPIRVAQGYGLTETSPTTHFCPPDKLRLGSIGFLLPNVQGRLVDSATGKDCKEGQEGEIWIAGPLVMRGYHNRPDATKEAIVEGKWFRTGDVGYIQDNYWYISDRIKEMIKYKGLQVFPAELEGLLLTHPLIADSAVVPVYSEEDATELPRAYVVTSQPIQQPDAFEEEVQNFVASKLAAHKRLRGGVIITKEIPKSPSGKILRRVLRDRKVPLKRRRRRDAKL